MSRPYLPVLPRLLPLLIGSALLLAGCDGGGGGEDTPVTPTQPVAGSLDSGFAAGGILLDQAGGASEQVLAMQVRGDGRVLSAVYNNRQLLLVRQLADGGLDTAWGAQGPGGRRIAGRRQGQWCGAIG